jgi:hypothetical protein
MKPVCNVGKGMVDVVYIVKPTLLLVMATVALTVGASSKAITSLLHACKLRTAVLQTLMNVLLLHLQVEFGWVISDI